ncbi:MAG TPA: flagellar protein [Firmicutes bacterium]|jgi:flagellar operon protein|nr:flagellar protein [Bacillota bacterium]
MDPRLSNRLYPTPQPIGAPGQVKRPAPKTTTSQGFQSLLDAALATQPLRFSKHATERLEQRQIMLTPADVTRLTRAVDNAASKGARDSLILLNRTAFVVNVPNRTVITAVDEDHMRENVFTNIDSAVVLN